MSLTEDLSKQMASWSSLYLQGALTTKKQSFSSRPYFHSSLPQTCNSRSNSPTYLLVDGSFLAIHGALGLGLVKLVENPMARSGLNIFLLIAAQPQVSVSLKSAKKAWRCRDKTKTATRWIFSLSLAQWSPIKLSSFKSAQSRGAKLDGHYAASAKNIELSMNSPESIDLYPSVSEDILFDSGAQDPVFEEIYPRLKGFQLGSTNSWTKGQPFDYYKRMREEAPVMWSTTRKPQSGFWSVSRYDDIKHVELHPEIFSSQRGSMHMSVVKNETGKAERLMYAAHNSLINLDADIHRDLRTQQAAFFFPKYIETLKKRVGKKIDDLLDNMERQGPVVDFAKLFSTELPMFTLCEMLGVDEEDRPNIIKWMHYLELAPQFLTHPFRMFMAEPMFPFRFEQMLHDMFSYGERVMADRIKNPRRPADDHCQRDAWWQTHVTGLPRWQLAAHYLCR